MQISPQGKDAIKSRLCLFMSEDESERFIDLEHSMAVIKQGQLCWQAPVSIGIHAVELYFYPKSDNDEAILSDLIGMSVEPVEALFKLLLPKPDAKALEDEWARVLFHTRFALGFLLLAKGEKKRAKAFLHEVAGTRVSKVSYTEIIQHWGDIWPSTDITAAKWHTALYLFLECWRQEALDHEELLYALAEAIRCAQFDTFVIKEEMVLAIMLPVMVLSSWTETCEKIDASQEYDFPDFRWLGLFTGAAELLSVCREADTAGDLPNKCGPSSPQHVAWYFGQIAGRFAVRDPRWSANLHEKTNTLHEAFSEQDSSFFTWGEEQSYRALRTVEALLSEFDVDRDWQKARQRYVEMWRRSDRWGGAVLSEISPESDLYWAIRIGLADTILEALGQQVTLINEPSTPFQRMEWRQIKSQLELEGIAEMQRQLIDMMLDGHQAERRVHAERSPLADIIAAGESAKVEFKSSLRWDWRLSEKNKDDLEMAVLKTIAAFLNSDGGTLLIGVNDNKQVVGLEEDYKTLPNPGRDSYERHLRGLVNERVGKKHCTLVTFTFYEVDGKDTCMLQIAPSRTAVFVAGGKEGKEPRFYIRNGNRTEQLNIPESIDYIREHARFEREIP